MLRSLTSKLKQIHSSRLLSGIPCHMTMTREVVSHPLPVRHGQSLLLRELVPGLERGVESTSAQEGDCLLSILYILFSWYKHRCSAALQGSDLVLDQTPR